MALRGLNPAWAKREGPVRSARNVWASQDLLRKDLNAASRPLTDKTDCTTETLDIKQKFKDSLANVATH